MERPPIRKASRTLNLMKPAPRKTNINGLINGAEKPEEAQVLNTEGVIAEKENKPVGKRAARGLKLEKPAPLKSSKLNKDETVFSDDSVPKNSRFFKSKPYDRTSAMEVQEQKCHERGQAQKATALPQTSAERKAAVLIKDALADMEELCEKSRPRQMHRQTQLLSQVSDDSGVGDMSWYSRQGSVLQSLSENQDDLDWNDIDDSAETTFSLTSKHLACLPSAVNQVQPFQSLLVGEQAFENVGTGDMKLKAKIKRGLKNSKQNNSNQHISRSYSVPASLYNSNNNNKNLSMETKSWDDEADFGIDNQVNSAQSFSHTQRKNRVRSLSLFSDTAKAGIRIGKTDMTKAESFIKERGGCDTHNTVTVIPGPKHSSLDLCTGIEDWEADIVDIEVSLPTPTTPVHFNNSGKSISDSAIGDQCSDPDATPKAKSLLPKFNDPTTCPTEKKLFTLVNSGKIQEGKQDCDKTIQNMTNLPSYQNYRDKVDSDISSCSSKSLKNSEDYLSQETLEEFDEQSYAWEFIDDLSEKVEAMVLGTKSKDMGPQDFNEQSYAGESTKDLSGKVDSEKLGQEDKEMGPHDVLEKLALQEALLSLDMDEIEAELEYMREDLEMSESANSDKYVNSMFRSQKPECVRKVIITREPLHPNSSQEEIWLVEEGMPTGHSTAKGRRGMFRYYRQCSIDDREEVTSEKFLQYSPEDLLLLGTREISKRRPETWAYLTKIYPGICLEQVSFFDVETYAKKRDNVVEVCNVVDDKPGYFRRSQR